MRAIGNFLSGACIMFAMMLVNPHHIMMDLGASASLITALMLFSRPAREAV